MSMEINENKLRQMRRTGKQMSKFSREKLKGDSYEEHHIRRKVELLKHMKIHNIFLINTFKERFQERNQRKNV